MKVILAQGNPGPTYANTRHNIGFMVLDYYADYCDATWVNKPKFKGLIAELTQDSEKVLLIKPLTFYNLTGQTARTLVDYYKINPDTDLMVVHDDLALEFGKMRIRQQGSDAGNNGIKSLNSHIGPNYTRLRIGTANPLLSQSPENIFVLSKFNKEEQATVNDKILPLSREIIDQFISGSLETTSYSVIK